MNGARLMMLVIALVTSPAFGAATRTDAVDVWSALQDARAERLGNAVAWQEGSDFVVAQMLQDPASPYSELNDSPDFTNEVDWPSAVDALDRVSMDDALGMMRWDLGLTRARPGTDVNPVPGYRDPFVAASAQKADVDPDIFWHALDLTGNRYSTQAAVYAVALQILRGQLRTIPLERQRELGVDSKVYERVMQTRGLSNARAYDLHYLSLLVRNRLVHWRPGGAASNGLRQLPVAYRIARVAAAYRDTQGYVSGGPCLPGAGPRPRVAGMATADDNRPLCFVAATDRAVFAWYRAESALQASGYLPNQHHHDGLERLLAFASAILVLMDGIGLIEGAEALVADDMVASENFAAFGTEAAPESSFRLTCRPTE